MKNLHYTTALEEDAEGWWPALCNCGADLSVYPTAEDAADALMQHAYVAGLNEGRKEHEL